MKFQPSASLPAARLMEGSGTLRLAMGGVLLIFGSALTVMAGASLATVLGAAGGSWVFSSVSTCSVSLGQPGLTSSSSWHARMHRAYSMDGT